MTDPPVRPGDVLVGKYRVDRVLGVGGMGVVVAATHLGLDEKVALKFLLPDVLQHSQAVARFLREARAAAKIRSEHVARVTDVGTLENGAPFIVMEYLVGTDLEHRVSIDGPLPVAEAIDYVLQACEALAEAHALGIVHRDLKPANLFLAQRPDGTVAVKVLDFGIAKMADGASGGSLTATGGLMGSALYMSPEQLQSAKDVDVRADVWALGVVLFQLLTGQHPFMADSIGQLVVQILTAPPRSFWDLRRDVPDAVVSAIEGALVKDRNARCANVGELAERLASHGGPSAALSVARIRRLGGGQQVASSGVANASASVPTPPPTHGVPAPALASAAAFPQTTSDLSSSLALGDAEPGAPVTRNRVGLSVVLIIAALVGVVGGSIAWVANREPSASHRPSGSATSEAEPKLVPAASAEKGSPVRPLESAVASTPLASEPSAPAPSVIAPPLATVAKPKPAASPITAASTAASSAPVKPTAAVTSSCDPPYVYDANGIKRFKPGCE